MPQPNRGVLRLPRGGGRGAGLKRLALEMKQQGYSYRAVAAELALSLGTVKSWCARGRKAAVGGGLQPGLQPLAAQGKVGTVKPAVQPVEPQNRGGGGVGGRGGLPGPGPAMFRGVTRDDLPGKSSWERSLNFRNLKKGTYPPRAWKIPGYLEGAALVEAIRVANAAKGRKKGNPEG